MPRQRSGNAKKVLSIRIDPELRQRIEAQSEDRSLLVTQAIEDYLKKKAMRSSFHFLREMKSKHS